MALFLFIVLPLGWLLDGRLLGSAVARTVPSEAGERIGTTIDHWGMILLPAAHVLLLLTAASGDAGHGMRLFGSEVLLTALCLPIYLVPALAVYPMFGVGFTEPRENPSGKSRLVTT